MAGRIDAAARLVALYDRPDAPKNEAPIEPRERGVLAGDRNLRPGDTSPGVAALQTALWRLGYRVESDGVYGQRTAAAVRHFQRHTNLAEDGIVGRATARELDRFLAKIAELPLTRSAP